MAVKVLMKRVVSPGHEAEVREVLRELRTIAMKHRGYVSGETLELLGSPGTLLVISTWLALEDWQNYENLSERGEVLRKLDGLLAEPSETTVWLETFVADAESVLQFLKSEYLK